MDPRKHTPTYIIITLPDIKDKGEVKNSTGNGETKELICMTQGHELMGGNVGGRWVVGWRGIKGRKKWDNCNSIINKIYLKNKAEVYINNIILKFCKVNIIPTVKIYIYIHQI